MVLKTPVLCQDPTSQLMRRSAKSSRGFTLGMLLNRLRTAAPDHATIQNDGFCPQTGDCTQVFTGLVCGLRGPCFGQDAPELELLDLNGKVLRIAWDQVKWVCYVRDLPAGDSANPERLLHKRFAIRPRTAGLWLRMTLTDGEELEGLAANDRSLVDGAGLLLTPPDTRSNTQRIYVPRQAIQTLEVVSLIGKTGRKHTAAAIPGTEQPDLFPSDPETT